MDSKLDIVSFREWGLFQFPRPFLIAGPCSAESEEQLLATARGLRAMGLNVFRAGVWKPRTHPGSFEGAGVPALKWLRRVKEETGLKISTEVAGARHVEACLEHGIDLLWIGARTTANPFLVQEIAEALRGTDIPVLVKNPVNPDLDLWIGALERLNREGVRKLGVIHRGFSTYEKIRYRNAPQWEIAIELRSRYPELAFFCDPSHMGGDRAYLAEISQRAMDLGLDGLMLESHCDPSCALSDARQQLTPAALQELVESLQVREHTSEDQDYRKALSELRARIDVIDENLLYMLGSRMKVSREIGRVKRDNNIAIIQADRWDEVLGQAREDARTYGLDKEFVAKFFSAIHEASVAVQNEILSGEE